MLAGQCKAKAALEPQDKACAILEKEFGAPHPQLALCLGNLAALHANLGEHARALTLKERALTMFAQVPGHPNHVAMARRNLVRMLLELGRLTEAESSLEAAAAVSQRETDETTVILLRGELRRLQGKTSDALGDAALSVARTQGGPIARRLDPLLLLAESHLTASHFADAAQAAQQAETIARSVYGGSSCRITEPLRLEVEALVGAGAPTRRCPSQTPRWERRKAPSSTRSRAPASNSHSRRRSVRPMTFGPARWRRPPAMWPRTIRAALRSRRVSIGGSVASDAASDSPIARNTTTLHRLI